MRHLKHGIGATAVAVILTALVPAVATAASISGTVTAEGGGPIAGAEVCPTPEPYSFERDCVSTAADGAYLIAGLPATSYHLRFSTPSRALNYVGEWYDNSQTYPGDLLTISGAGEAVTGVDAELEPGGVIRGTATDGISEGPAGGVWVWIDPIGSIFYGIGFRAEADGSFEANDIPTGEYRVYFNGENDVNYLGRYYDESETSAGSTPVSVVAGSVVSGIDVRLYPGAEISGTVTETETGETMYGVRVCAREQSSATARSCQRTGLDGSYAIRSLPAGDYIVEFGSESGPFGYSIGQWWNQASSIADADPITIAPPEAVVGFDGSVPWYFGEEPPKPEEGGVAASAPPPVTVTTPTPPRPAKCKKGFHRKLVKGKKRCVRKHHGRRPYKR
jgi:carboxypeptidase family protein